MSNLTRAKAAWSGGLPDWVEALATACDEYSQRQVAVKLGYSAGTVNAVVNNKWPAKTEAIEAAVREHLMASTVICPVQGEIRLAACRDNQALPFATTNNMRVRLYHACRSGCQHSRLDHESARD
ncbi:MAG: transcriptional regulator [Thermodesulfobacteriota bacterium]